MRLEGKTLLNKVRRDMSEKQKYIDFEAYERVAEPHKRERVSAWRTAIGLQDVDGLRVSDYLKEIAVKHIEGDIMMLTMLKRKRLTAWRQTSRNC